MVASRIFERFFDALPAFITGGIIVGSIWMFINIPYIFSIVTLVWAWYLVARATFGLYAHARGLAHIYDATRQDWCALYADFMLQNPTAMSWDVVHHIVLLPNDHEPIDILRASIGRLAQCAEAHHITLVLAMEARELDAVYKATCLQTEFEKCFAEIIVTYHPDGQADEIPCKSANIRYAIRQAQNHLQRKGYHPDDIIVTAMDADTLWHPQYFSALTYHFIIDDQRYTAFWQAPIRYHGKIENLHPALRLVNVYASALELSYLTSWWMALPISSYSVSLHLLVAHDYWDRDVIAEEWRMFLKAYFGTNGCVRVVPIFLPFIATVVQGATFWEAARNRYFQTVRHALGSKEIGYAISKALRHKQISLYRRLRLVGRVAHDITIAGAGWAVLLLGGQGIMLLYGLAGYNWNWGVLIAIQTAFVVLSVLAVWFWGIDNKIRQTKIFPQSWREWLQTISAFLFFPVLIFFLLVLPVLHAQMRLLLGLPLKFRVSPKASFESGQA